MRDDFAVFITSHESPYVCKSLTSLVENGYTGAIYLVIDDMDKRIVEYKSETRKTLVFHKLHYVETLDIGMSTYNPQLAAVLYARAAVEDFAKALGLKYFCVMDDDLIGFRVRLPIDNKLASFKSINLDRVFDAYIEYMDNTPICCLSFANDGSFIGGVSAFDKVLERRSCHTVFIRDTERPFDWSFAVNEDYISSLRMSNVGSVMFTLPFVQRTITGMGDRDEGMSDVYKTTSDFQRAFYATIARPDVCLPRYYNDKFVIGVNKKGAYPKIISDYYAKSKILSSE